MKYVLCVLSFIAGGMKTALFNHAGKSALKGRHALFLFNAAMFSVTFSIFLLTALGKSVSAFTVALGLAFGTVIVLHSVCSISALARGPMHVTVLIMMSALIIPSLYDSVVTKTVPTVGKIAAILVLFVFIFLSVGKSDGTKARGGWYFFVVCTFLLEASIGILQKIHQSSAHKAETSAFLACAFFCSLLFALVMSVLTKKDADGEAGAPLRSVLLLAAVCGVCEFLNHDLNLKLSGMIPSEIFFPLANGGMLFLNTLAALVIFKEKLTRAQLVGVIGGIATLILICILP